MGGQFVREKIRYLKGLDAVLVRIINAYGPREDPTSPYASDIAKFCASVASNEGIEIYGDGRQTRDFLYVGDLTTALELAGERPGAGQILKGGSGSATSGKEVAGPPSEIPGRPIPTKQPEPPPRHVPQFRPAITRSPG